MSDLTGNQSQQITEIGIAYRRSDKTYIQDSTAGAAGIVTATLAGAIGKRTWISGFTVTGAGATAATIVTVTITGISTTLRYSVVVPAGAGTTITPLVVTFPEPIPSTAANTPIVVTVPSFGVGNTAATVAAHGFQL